MYIYKSIIFLLTITYISAVFDLSEGDTCLDSNGVKGTCVGIEHCHSVDEIAKKKFNSTICGFNATDPFVCCLKSIVGVRTKLTKTCDPITKPRPDLKTGRIAFRKCVEFQEQLKYPCVPSNASDPEGPHYRRDACYDPPPPFSRLGYDAHRGQYPHMALLGYSKELSKPDTAEWLCGGTVISERFVLTAGHCTIHTSLGPVAFARLGILMRSDRNSGVRDYSISRIVKHPEYKPPSKYHDIALLETKDRIEFLNKHIGPACLDIGDNETESEAAVASATGWGEIDDWGNADILQIMDIVKFSSEECSEEFRPHRLLKSGLDKESQICYGHRVIPRDTCTGDRGGPLQVEYSGVLCMHKVIGVTSFGKACGHTGVPGVYTRVLNYVPWIESVVWPGEE